MKLKELIKAKTAKFLEADGIVCCQNITGVGSLQDTFPSDMVNHPGVWEMQTSDVSNPGTAVGAAMSGRRVMYVIRFAGFLWLNASTLVNYGAKCREIWNQDCRLFTRIMTAEQNIGPVASHSHNSLLMRMPGVKLFAPITPCEWWDTWTYFMSQDDPVFCSEHRLTYNIDYEIEDIIRPDAKLTIFAISYARVNSLKVAQELGCNFINIIKLKPFKPKPEQIEALKQSGKGVIIDTDLEICGASRDIAYQLMHMSGVPVHALGLGDFTAGFAPCRDNLTPSVEKIRSFCEISQTNP